MIHNNNNNNNNKGFTLVELVVSMVILTILGSVVVNILNNTNRQYFKLYKEYDRMTEARIATSYIVTKLRENDQRDCISIKDNKLIIKNNNGNKIYEIYVEENILKEKTKGVPLNIAKNINYFDIEQNDKEFDIKVGYFDSSFSEAKIKKMDKNERKKKTKKIAEKVVLRSY